MPLLVCGEDVPSHVDGPPVVAVQGGEPHGEAEAEGRGATVTPLRHRVKALRALRDLPMMTGWR